MVDVVGSPHIVVPCCYVLVVLGLIISGAAGIILVGRAAAHTEVSAALMCLGAVG